ncbi:SCO1431 family membrane protein [Streptomyces varsoviensis]|uniref:SCO1431 family membrane protein n=1 Tax=Streptomyces varsoviensis TaxID=67373 RepID=UPI0034066621
MAEMAGMAKAKAVGMAETAASRAGTGGPSDKNKIVEQIVGWALVVVLAMLVTQLGLA